MMNTTTKDLLKELRRRFAGISEADAHINALLDILPKDDPSDPPPIDPGGGE